MCALVMGGCEERDDAVQATAAVSASALPKGQRSDTAARPVAPRAGPPAQSPGADGAAIAGGEEAARLAQLGVLPLLSLLSDAEQAGLLKELPAASPFERLSLINRYPGIAALPDQQKQVLLYQLEQIVPVTTPTNLLVCHCSNEIKRESCVQEDCANQAALRFLCNRACGTLAAFQRQCRASPRCEPRR